MILLPLLVYIAPRRQADRPEKHSPAVKADPLSISAARHGI
jgi:hypothetical protein